MKKFSDPSANRYRTRRNALTPQGSRLNLPVGQPLASNVDRLSWRVLLFGLMRICVSHGLPCTAVEADVPSGPLGHRWRGFSLPGWFWESAQPIRLWRRLRRFLGGARSLNVVCSWGASRRNQAKSGYPESNVRLWGHSGLSGSLVVVAKAL